MNLVTKLGLKLGQGKIVLVGTPIETSHMSAEKNEPYYVCKLETPITVRCSINSTIPAFETDEVYVRESALAMDGWKFADETKPELGFWMDGWVADFSINQEIPIYQPETISSWRRDTRGVRRSEHVSTVVENLRKKYAVK